MTNDAQIYVAPKKSPIKIVAKIAAVILIGLICFIAGYALYLETGYYRIEDNAPIEALDQQARFDEPLKKNVEYNVLTYNIGFGAYTPEYTFFMDEGIMKDGTKKKGTSSRAASKESVIECTNGDIELINEAFANVEPDFLLLQEVDTDATRSYHVNQLEYFTKEYTDHEIRYTPNFHAGYMMYPIYEPHGSVQAGLVTLSQYSIDSCTRRSYPIDQSWPAKYFDLDRCFMVSRIPVEDGHELVLINSHMSAYDKGGVYRAKQLELLNKTLSEEYAKGNYVVAGGDWNHALAGSVDLYKSAQAIPPWVNSFNDKDLAEGFSVVVPDNLAEVPTCRGDDIPYEKNYTYTTTVDGFIVSDNIKADARTIDAAFQYSDHNPQIVTFELVD